MWFKSNPKNDNNPNDNNPNDNNVGKTVGDRSSQNKTFSRPRRKNQSSDRSRATTIMKAMSNSQRLQILSHLINGEERSVKELEDMIQTLSQSALSQHLGRLRRAKILKARRHSQMVFYSISDQNVQDIMALLNKIYDQDPVLTNKLKN